MLPRAPHNPALNNPHHEGETCSAFGAYVTYRVAALETDDCITKCRLLAVLVRRTHQTLIVA